jgi:hypothetical protein
MSDTVNVPIPRSAVEVIQSGTTVGGFQSAMHTVREAVKAASLPPLPDPPGTVYVDPDGDLWIIGPNGKLGLVIIDVPEFISGNHQQTIHFRYSTEQMADADWLAEGWQRVYWPGPVV